MRKCCICKRDIRDDESCWRDLHKKIVCNECYDPVFKLTHPFEVKK